MRFGPPETGLAVVRVTGIHTKFGWENARNFGLESLHGIFSFFT
jgi:hypothetical protein